MVNKSACTKWYLLEIKSVERPYCSKNLLPVANSYTCTFGFIVFYNSFCICDFILAVLTSWWQWCMLSFYQNQWSLQKFFRCISVMLAVKQSNAARFFIILTSRYAHLRQSANHTHPVYRGLSMPRSLRILRQHGVVMFPTGGFFLGFFKGIPCPFFEHGLCHRAKFHYSHSKLTQISKSK